VIWFAKKTRELVFIFNFFFFLILRTEESERVPMERERRFAQFRSVDSGIVKQRASLSSSWGLLKIFVSDQKVSQTGRNQTRAKIFTSVNKLHLMKGLFFIARKFCSEGEGGKRRGRGRNYFGETGFCCFLCGGKYKGNKIREGRGFYDGLDHFFVPSCS